MSRKIERRAPRVQFQTTGASRTKQSFREECNINNVMRRFEKTGILEHTNRYEGSYGDFTAAPSSYHEAVEQVIAAEKMFMSLPASVRKRFSNDPGLFLDFVEDPSNVDEVVKLGLATKREQEVTTPDSKKAAAGADTPASSKAAIPPDGG
jgi:Chlamydia-phage Chp2 scaffold (Chlamy_scaf).